MKVDEGLKKLMDLYLGPQAWIQKLLALDANGKVCKSDAAEAAAWCLTGGIRKVFGSNMNDYEFRCSLYESLLANCPEGISPQPGTHMAMCQQINDHPKMDYQMFMGWLSRTLEYSKVVEIVEVVSLNWKFEEPIHSDDDNPFISIAGMDKVDPEVNWTLPSAGSIQPNLEPGRMMAAACYVLNPNRPKPHPKSFLTMGIDGGPPSWKTRSTKKK